MADDEDWLGDETTEEREWRESGERQQGAAAYRTHRQDEARERLVQQYHLTHATANRFLDLSDKEAKRLGLTGADCRNGPWERAEQTRRL